MTGLLVVVVTLAVASAAGLWIQRSGHRLARRSRAGVGAGPVLAASDLGADLGERATLVQFSSAFCQPCRATRRILDEVSATVAGVAHVEIDAESHLDLVRRLDVRRTPTVLVLDASGAWCAGPADSPARSTCIAALGEAVR